MFPPFKPILYHTQVKCKFLQNRQNWLRFQILKGSFLLGQQPVIYETTAFFFFFCIRNKWFWSLLKWGELTFDLQCVLPMAFAVIRWGKDCGGWSINDWSSLRPLPQEWAHLSHCLEHQGPEAGWSRTLGWTQTWLEGKCQCDEA